MESNDELIQIYTQLVDMMYEQFGVEPHPFDHSFFFHATLFLGESGPKLDNAYESIKNVTTPKILHANHFLIGSSVSGQAGDFAVIKDVWGQVS